LGRCDIGDDEKIEEAELDEISKLQKELSEFDKQRTFSNKKDVAIFIPNRVLIFPDQVLKIALKSFIKFYFIKHVLNLFYSFLSLQNNNNLEN